MDTPAPPAEKKSAAPRVGFVSLDCSKALVDSERITRLRAEGYGFLDSAKQDSLDAIGEALYGNGKVVVTGCLGVEEDRYEQVVSEIHSVLPPAHQEKTLERIARSAWDVPEIDGCVFLNGESGLEPGDRLNVRVTHLDEYDLWAQPAEAPQ